MWYNYYEQVHKQIERGSEMPKIIPNAPERMIAEARRQIDERGYGAVTIRSIVGGCGFGLGTFYNYFRSKDMLIATFLLDDWRECLGRVSELSAVAKSPMEVVGALYSELCGFMARFEAIFKSDEAIKVFKTASDGGRHELLRDQIAEPILVACERSGMVSCEFLSQFVAESILTWAVAGKDYSEVEPLISRLFGVAEG